MKNKKLHNIKSTGFKTPNDYFKSFEDNFFTKLDTESNLNSAKKTGFKVPDNYFENINIDIPSQDSKKQLSKVIPLVNKRNLIYISSIAATILLLFNLSVFKNAPTFSDLDIETVTNYVENEDYNAYELAAILTDEYIKENIIINHAINQNIIEQYLLDNGDIEALLIE